MTNIKSRSVKFLNDHDVAIAVFVTIAVTAAVTNIVVNRNLKNMQVVVNLVPVK